MSEKKKHTKETTVFLTVRYSDDGTPLGFDFDVPGNPVENEDAKRAWAKRVDRDFLETAFIELSERLIELQELAFFQGDGVLPDDYLWTATGEPI